MNITWSIFPKFFKDLNLDGLATMIRHVGLDTTNLVIRDGYWVTMDTLRESVPAFVRTMAAAGLEVSFATTGFMASELVDDDTPLAVLADSGVTEFRMGYFRWDKSRSPSACMDDARKQMALLARICEKRGVRAVYQVHHGTLIPSAWPAWELVRDLPPKQVGVMLDPGNQVNEGWDDWNAAVRLMGEHLVSMGIKDGGVYRDGDLAGEAKGWRKTLGISMEEGVVNWYAVARALQSVDFRGTFVYMPFYHTDDPATMAVTLKAEVAYLRNVMAAVESEES